MPLPSNAAAIAATSVVVRNGCLMLWLGIR
jgi:hypothetical protein